MEVSGQLHAPAALSPGNSPRYPLDRRMGGPQSRPGRGGQDKNPSLFRELNLGLSTRSLLLYWLPTYANDS